MLKPRILLANLKIKEVIYKCKSTWLFAEERQEENWEEIARRFRKTKKYKTDYSNGNPRKYFGETTIQEKLSDDSFKDQLADDE